MGTDFPLPSNSRRAWDWFLKFKTLGFSQISNFDWSQLSQQIRHSEMEVEDYVEAQPGTIIEVYQVVGLCEKKSVRTSFFMTTKRVSNKLKNCLPQDVKELILQCDATEAQVNSFCN